MSPIRTDRAIQFRRFKPDQPSPIELVKYSIANPKPPKSQEAFRAHRNQLLAFVKDYYAHYVELGINAVTERGNFLKIVPHRKVEDGEKNLYLQSMIQTAKFDFRTGRYYESLKKLSRAIKTCAHNSNMLSECYLTRSGVLFTLKMYRECIKDIESVPSNMIPEYLSFDIQNRCAVAQRNLDNQPLYADANPKFMRSEKIKCASKAVELVSTEQGRRKVFATEDIKIGDVISVEDPLFVGCITLEELHCYHCMKMVFCPVPCAVCPLVQFCSEDCKLLAWQTYHSYECGIILALRELKEYSIVWKIVLSAYYYLEHDRNHKIFEILSFNTPETSIDPNRLDALQKIAARIAIALATTKIIEQDYPIEPQLRILNALVMKSILIKELYCKYEHKEVRIKENRRKIAEFAWYSLFPFQTAFRHSCIPNVMIIQSGTRNIARALVNIKKGEELLISYGGNNYWTQPIDLRIHFCKRFGIECDCFACLERWPLNFSFAATISKEDYKRLNIIENIANSGNLEYGTAYGHIENVIILGQKMVKASAEFIQFAKCFTKLFSIIDAPYNAYSLTVQQFSQERYYMLEAQSGTSKDGGSSSMPLMQLASPKEYPSETEEEKKKKQTIEK